VPLPCDERGGGSPQVCVLCFSYDISAPPGSRVTGAVRQAADGSCADASVDLTAGSTYLIAENDFMASGGTATRCSPAVPRRRRSWTR